MKQKLAYYIVVSTPKRNFPCTLSYFMATYRNSLCRYCQLWSLFVSLQLKNWFFEAKRLCQRIKHRFVVFVLTNSNTDIMQVICTERHMIMVDDEDRR